MSEAAERAIANGECAAQVEVLDAQLRESLVRNVAAALDRRERLALERAATAILALRVQHSGCCESDWIVGNLAAEQAIRGLMKEGDR